MLLSYHLLRLALLAIGILGITLYVADAETIVDSINDDVLGGRVLYTLDDFEPYYDNNGKLSTYLLLYPASCSSMMEEYLLYPLSHNQRTNRFYGRKVHPVAGDVEMAFFGTNVAGQTMECNTVCVDRGVDKSLIQYVMPHFYYIHHDKDNENEEESGRRKRIDLWYRDTCEKVEYGFINYLTKDRPLYIMWIDYDDNRVLDRTIGYANEYGQILQTFLGHKFEIIDPQSGEVVLEHVVEYPGFRTIGQYVIPEEAKQAKGATIEDELKEEFYNLHWNSHKQVKRTFSANGFALGRLPDDVFASMGAYYYNNQHNLYLEEWNLSAHGISVNWWEVDAHFMTITGHLKYMWQIRLKRLVEDWTNTQLEQTAMYGIRQYEPGARLLTHVDLIETHAASLIVNVAQGPNTKPWRVEVHDHAERLHEVNMQPGDIVYYESAKLLHGRNTPLKGGYYANIFTHYRPVGDPNWYKKENDDNNNEQKPLLDVGECQLVGSPNVYSQGSVQCDDPRIGPHLSPALFIPQSADDLFRWWKKTSPQKLYSSALQQDEL